MSIQCCIPEYKVAAMMKEFGAGKPLAGVLADVCDRYEVTDGTYIWTQIYPEHEDYLEERRFLEKLGMAYFQTKADFILFKFDKNVMPSYRLSFRTAESVSEGELVELVAECISHSLDRDATMMCRANSPSALASEIIADALGSGHLSSEKSWWQIAISHGRAAGVVLPVQGHWSENGLGPGGFFWIGVRPESRGHGFGTELVIRGSEVLDNLGVWQVHNSADIENTPMIRAFRRARHEEVATFEKYGMYWHRRAV
jgi:GNAT superfamily N-acetyltransferase